MSLIQDLGDTIFLCSFEMKIKSKKWDKDTKIQSGNYIVFELITLILLILKMFQQVKVQIW